MTERREGHFLPEFVDIPVFIDLYAFLEVITVICDVECCSSLSTVTAKILSSIDIDCQSFTN